MKPTSDPKKPSILDIIHQEYPEYKPSDKAKNVIDVTFKKFRLTADDRNRNFAYFDNINLIDYIDDSVHRFTTNIDERDSLEDWQARVNTPVTRNKVKTVLGKVVSTLPIAQFKTRGEDDVRKGIILTNLYEYVEDKEDYEEVMTQILLESIVKGTAIGYEGVTREEKKYRDVTGVGDDITITENSEKYTCFPTMLVPLEDFYPSSVQIRTISNMPYCFWRSIISFSDFKQNWGNYKLSEFVVPRFNISGNEVPEQKPFYFDYVSQDVTEGNVEVIRYYNKMTDEFIIIANGVWLNPIKTKDDIEEISPVPFNHKRLPFFEIKFDHFGDWFYGKSLPDSLKSMQDVLNVLTNMLLDQSFLTIFPPLLTNGSDSIEDDYLRPGRRTPIDTQGQPLSQAIMPLNMGVPTGWHQYILEYTNKIMEQASVDQVSSGQAGVGGRTTAQEINTAAAAVAQTLGIFGSQINYGLKQKSLLKAANILQFGTDEKLPLVEKILGKDGAAKMAKYFNIIKLDDTYLTGGKRGTKIIEMYADKSDMPTKDELKARQVISQHETGINTEITAFPASYIRNFEYDVKMIPNPKSNETKEIAKALQLEKVRVYLSFFPEMIDKAELAAGTMEIMGDDPSKLLKPDVLNPQPAPVLGQGDPSQQMSPNPQGNTANNMVRGSQGGETAANQMNIMLKGNI